eukprot:SAG11_NODE_254_length_11587_cov_4.312913_13_plen_74_part_00
MEDKLVAAYDELLRSKSSAEEYAEKLMRYSEPSSMLPGPIAEPTTVLETKLHNPRVMEVWSKQRPINFDHGSR